MNRLSRVFPYLLLAPTIIPLVVCGGLYFPYLFPKVILLYALVLLALAAFVHLSSRGETFYFGRLKAWVTWIPAVLLVLAYVASLFGIDFYKSFWSIFGRGDGLLQLTLSIASFYLILISADLAFFHRFVLAVAGVGTVVAVWGIGEWFITGGRISSSLGNPAFLAGYLALSFFVTLAASRENLSSLWRRMSVGSAGIQLIAVVLTATRGSILALGLAGVLALVYLGFWGSGNMRRWSIAGLLSIIVLASGFYLLRDSLAQSSFEPLARIAHISTNDPDIANRLFVWEHMVQEIGKSPLLGYGTEQIAHLFDKFYDPGVITEEWFDRAHNAYLDYAAQYGVFGALLYLALIGSLLWSAFQYSKRDRLGGLIFALAAVTYAAQNFFVFDTVSSWWLFLAILAVLLAQNNEVPKTTIQLFRSPSVGVGVSVVLSLLIIPVSVLPLLANYDLTRGYYYHVIDVSRANAYFNKGLALGTYGDLEYGYQLHSMYTDEQASLLTGEARVAAYTIAKNVLMRNYERYPYDARTAVYLADVLDSAPPKAPANPELVRAVVTQALTLSPKRAQTWYVLANLSIGSAKDLPRGHEKTTRYNEAIGVLEAYIILVPTLSEPHYVLADLYWAIGDTVQAKVEAAIGNANYRGETSVAERAALFYERAEDWEYAMIYLQKVVDHDKNNIVFYYDLAKVKYMTGDYVAALAIVEDLRVRSPEVLSTDQNFLDAITAYEQSKK